MQETSISPTAMFQFRQDIESFFVDTFVRPWRRRSRRSLLGSRLRSVRTDAGGARLSPRHDYAHAPDGRRDADGRRAARSTQDGMPARFQMSTSRPDRV